MKYDIRENRGNLINIASKSLRSGITIDNLYKEFHLYFESNKMDDDLANEIIDVLNILSGYKNPYVTVDANGINCNIQKN